ncbi:MAG: glycosyltransferase 87 family protein [Solirubrobacterales bacterium]
MSDPSTGWAGRLGDRADRIPPWAIAAVAVLAHLWLMGRRVGAPSFILDKVFRTDAISILGGLSPYGDVGFEYPPLALPILLGPEAATNSTADAYREVFGGVMVGFDLLIVGLLVAAFWRRPARMLGALVIFSAGLFLLKALPLSRFDLVPAALTLAAALARERGRSAAWGALLGLGGAVKAYPLVLAPLFAAGEQRPLRALAGLVAPMALAAGLVVGIGDEAGSAVLYHTDRALQIETLASSALIGAQAFGADLEVVFTSGSFNIAGDGAELARVATSLLTGLGYLAVVTMVWRRRVPPVEAATAAIAVFVVLGPVLSPQFLLWMLPLSAAAFGVSPANLLLVLATWTTRLLIDHGYAVQVDLGTAFVVPLAGRNLLLAAYLVLVVAGLRRHGLRDRRHRRPRGWLRRPVWRRGDPAPA